MQRTEKVVITTQQFLNLVNYMHGRHRSKDRHFIDWAEEFATHGYLQELHNIDMRSLDSAYQTWLNDYTTFSGFTFHNSHMAGKTFDRCTFKQCSFVKMEAASDVTNCLFIADSSEQELSFLNQHRRHTSRGNVIISAPGTTVEPVVVIVYTPKQGTSYTDKLVQCFNARQINIVKLYSEDFYDSRRRSKTPDHPIFLDPTLIHGIILPGGDNIITDRSKYDKREKLELYLLELSMQHSIPFLGVCRGHQLVSHYFGAEVKDIEFDIHQETIDVSKNPQSLLYQLAERKYLTQLQNHKERKIKNTDGIYTYQAHCNHYQGVFFKPETSKELIITASSRDGTPESLQVRDHIITFQHHHEDRQEDRLAKAILKLFAKMVLDYQRHQSNETPTLPHRFRY
jgi:gamma-glutamyl-gamma-aminobutyrate hydrolase PuuD